jgi:hypothetical protein
MKNRYSMWTIIIIIFLLIIYLLLNNNSIEKFTNIERLNVAVFFSGRIKDYELELKHLIELKKKYNATFFVSVNESLELDYMKSFFKTFDVGDDQKNIESTPTPSNLILLYCENYPKANYSNVFSMYYHNYKCYDLINKYQIKNSIIFDVIVKYRVDIHSNDTISLIKPNYNTIYIPEGYDYEGLNDQIAYGDNESMKLYCSVLLILSNLCMKKINFHPESLLDGGVKSVDLKIIRIPYKYVLHKNIAKSD